MEVQLRSAVPEDRPWLFQLHEDAHRDLVEQAYGPWDVEQQLQFFQPLMEDHAVFIVELGGSPVGAVYLGSRDNDLWLELIEVVPGLQGQGIGSAALGWVVTRAREEGRGTRLQVHKLNTRAHQLYEREGFTRADETTTHHLLRHQ